MNRCLQLAKSGLGNTYPNPLVGSVIVHKDKIIGEGWHRLAGSPHAEVNAIQSVSNREWLADSTLYVNLEPCSHFGRTPPCADLLISLKIPRVVVGCLDPNPEVAGRGIHRMRQAGIDVTVGILEDECREANRRFFTNHIKHRPYVILKWAESSDGFIAPLQNNDRKPYYISGELSRQLVHRWRTQEDAILVGASTVLADDPLLDVREWTGNAPVKIVLDRSGRINSGHRVANSGKTIVFSAAEDGIQSENIIFETVDFGPGYPDRVLKRLYELGVCSVIVEGGRITLQSFIDCDTWDEARIFRCDTALGNGIDAPGFTATPAKVLNVGPDRLFIYRNL